MSCTGASDIGLFATGLWESLGNPTDVSALTISGWVYQTNTLGTLNNLIDTCYTGGNGYVCPDLTNTEYSILGAMYQVQFYRNRANALAGTAGTTLSWYRLREGDSDIARANPSEMMKTFQKMAKEANDELNKMVSYYNKQSQGGNVPRSVDFYNVSNGPVYFNEDFY